MNPQPPQDGSVELEAIAQNGLHTNDILSNIDASNEASAVKLHELAQGQEAQIIQAQDHTEKVIEANLNDDQDRKFAKSVGSVVELIDALYTNKFYTR